jgi:Zn-dependent protease
VDESIRLGTIFGLRIGVNWSLGVVFLLLAYTLAGGFQQDIAGLPEGAYWGAAVVAALLFYASLLAHEIGHALMARRLGVEVEGITLWLFGGVARLRGQAATAGTEAKIAVVGPLVSVALGALFFGSAFAVQVGGGPDLVGEVLFWLAATNIVLAVFNLVPAFPLDGGRLLKSLLWKRSRNRFAATRTAARVGRAFGFILIAAGLFRLLFGDVVQGIWGVFLGWFLLGAARSEESQVMLGGALAGVRVADVMTPEPFVGPGWVTVDEFLHSYAATYRYTVFPIRSFEGELAGVVTLKNLTRVEPERRRATRVGDVACPLEQVATAGPEELLVDVLPRMGSSCSEGRVLVRDAADGNRLLGIVSPADVTRLLLLRGASV